jgi:hypothetical protein
MKKKLLSFAYEQNIKVMYTYMEYVTWCCFRYTLRYMKLCNICMWCTCTYIYGWKLFFPLCIFAKVWCDIFLPLLLLHYCDMNWINKKHRGEKRVWMNEYNIKNGDMKLLMFLYNSCYLTDLWMYIHACSFIPLS